MPYCTLSPQRRFTVLGFKSWAFNCSYGYYHQHFTAHAQKRLFMNFRDKFRPHRSIPRSRFLYRVRDFGDLATFSIDFCILFVRSSPYFYFRFVWPTDLESIPHASTLTSIIPTKFEAPTLIRFWVMSDNVSPWLPLKMRMLPLRMCQITWPVSRASKTITFL